ncbi:PA14 domain-containing protein [Roseateles sp. BYS180W]|uniref:PA14 domain-containing protein n=2 Tax=Roseateles rivi TaxID=3299028 RepID=A0ABW7FWT5_9BURK
MANEKNVVINPGTAKQVVLGISKAAVAKVVVMGTDLVLQLKDGSTMVLRDVALRQMLEPDLKVVFNDQTTNAEDLFRAVGKVDMIDQLAHPMVSSTPKVPVSEETVRNEAAPAQDSVDHTPQPTLPQAQGIVTPDLSAAASKEASLKYSQPPAAPTVVVSAGKGDAPATTPGGPTNPPAPPKPVDTIGVGVQAYNVTGQSTGSDANGRVTITGGGGSLRSATDFSAPAQAEREQIKGSGEAEVMVGDDTALLGTGWARQLDLMFSARAALEVKSVTLRGLPPDVTVVGGTLNGDAWKLDIASDLAASGNKISIRLMYPVASDETPFTPRSFDLSIDVAGLMEGKGITGTRVIPTIIQDVRSAADMVYAPGGKTGLVLPAFGLGDDIRAGGGNDVVHAGYGHDLVYGEAGNDLLEGEAGDDTLNGGTGGDTLDGGTGKDWADYSDSADAIKIDLQEKTADGGDAAGDVLKNIENLAGSQFNDTLSGDAGNNALRGQDGDDVLTGRAGADTLDGGEGFDTASYLGSATAIQVNLATGVGTGGDAEGDVLSNIEAVIGGEGNDKITGDRLENMLDGRGGNDTLDGGAGADTLRGGAGNDTVTYVASAEGVRVSLETGKGLGGDAEGDRLQDVENLVGSRLADELTGDAKANQLSGGMGDDWLEGGAGADTLIGGEGHDTASYLGALGAVNANLSDASANVGDAAGDSYQSIENLEGSEYNDTLTGDDNANVLMGNPGDDQLFGRGGNDTLIGGAGADIMDGGEGVDLVDYSASTSSVQVDLSLGGRGGDATGDQYSNIENVLGTRYADSIVGDASANVLDGQKGADTLEGGAGADTLIGGEGSDTASYTRSGAAVRVDLATGGADGGDATGDKYESIENLAGSQFDDQLQGDNANNRLLGDGGNDWLEGRMGNDTLRGDDGDDTLTGGTGADTLEGGAGIDTADYQASAEAVHVDLSSGKGRGGDAEGDLLSTIENIAGSAGNDTLYGDAGANLLSGRAGDDWLEGGSGADTLDGGEGKDTAAYGRATAGVLANLADASHNLGDAAGDQYSSIENLSGSAFNDTLTGDLGDNRIAGDAGDDLIAGAAGADTLDGGEGIDTATYIASGRGVNVDLFASTASGGDATGDLLTGIENLTGSNSADQLRGDAGVNVLSGMAGDDVLEGRGGADVLDGGDGSDTATYASASAGVWADLLTPRINAGDAAGDQYISIENLSGSALNDTLAGDDADNRLSGQAGNDVLIGGLGADVLDGGEGNDTASYQRAAVGVNASLATPDSNTGEAAADQYVSIENLTGSTFADTLTGDTGDNRLSGLAGNDLLVGGAGADTLDGGEGTDTVTYAVATDAVVVNLTTGKGAGAEAEGDKLLGVENLIGSEFNDQLTGSEDANVLEGGLGNDTLEGAAGADTLIGGQGVDTASYTGATAGVTASLLDAADNVGDAQGDLYTSIENLQGSANADTLIGDGANNRLSGGDGDDTLMGGTGADTLDGGDGNNTASYTNASAGVVANLTLPATNSSDAQGDVYINIANLSGSAFDDQLSGDAAANRLLAGAGNDTLQGGAGADTLDGGAGIDTASYAGSGLGVNVNLSTGLGQGGDAQGDRLSNIENLVGSVRADALTGSALANRIEASGGDDTLDGGAGDDTLLGGEGDDNYMLDSQGDVVIENGAEGTDTVRTSVSYTLVANVENGVLLGTNDLNLSGNELDNQLTGNDGNNLIDGKAGADSMAGGLGDDTYVVDNTGDGVTEQADAGRDLVLSSVSYSLSDNVEDITLTGAGAINATGNALNNVLTGNTGNNRLDGGAGADQMRGGQGDDTYVVDHAGDVVTELVSEGTDTVRSSIGYTLTANVENLVLTGGAAINATGNALNNVISGNSGANQIDGGAGADTMAGGAGDDSYSVDDAGDVVTEAAGEGSDSITASVSYTLADNVENLTLTGIDNLNATGNALDNQLTGNDGDNIIDGAAGADTMTGGRGNDTYYVDSSSDRVNELMAQGTDQVFASASFVLSDNIENITLTGVGTINATGNALDNRLVGNSGNNVLDGGAGADTMAGGDGDDTYAVDNVNDVVSEYANQGTDTLRSTLSYTLGDNLENLVLLGNGDLTGTGNALNNQISGNDGSNIIDGGAGSDVMAGGLGDDVYYVDNTADQVIEGGNEGNDRVYASVSYTLAANIERLTLTGFNSVDGTGNTLNNTLDGNSGNNVLDGGAGNDTMTGGAGNDTYVVDSAADQISEDPGNGIDTVRASVSWTLGNNLENLTLTGSGSLNGTGNSLANQITGNGGDNVLTGGGGADTLDGGAGADTFVLGDLNFVTATGGAGFDTVKLDGTAASNPPLTGLANQLINIEALDFSGSQTDYITLPSSLVNAPGFVGSDSGGRLEVLGDGVASLGGRDVLLLSSSEYNNVTDLSNASAITLHSGVAGRLITPTSPGLLNLAVSDNLQVLPAMSDLDNWGRVADPSLSQASGMLSWLDASDVDGDGVVEGINETGLVAGNKLTTWVDKSGNGYNFTQTTSGNQAVLNTTAVNGRDALLFSGGQVYLSGLNLGRDYSIIVVGTPNSGTQGRLISASDNNSLIGTWSNTQDNMYVSGWVTGAGLHTVTQATQIFTGTSYQATNGSNGTAALYNGVALQGSNTNTGNWGTMTVGGALQWSEYFRGYVSEVVVLDHSAGVFERQILLNSLSPKWAATTSYTAPSVSLLGSIAGDASWSQARLAFGSTGADTLTASYTGTSSRGTGLLDAVVFGGDGNDTLTGGGRNDALFGGAGNDSLVGGSGAAWLAGGAGDDSYVVSNMDHTVYELASQGTDTVRAGVSYVLPKNVENLVLTGTSALNGTGNALANTITGNSANNLIDGKAGADTLVGGAGDDTYYVDNVGDVVTENASEGTDQVYAWANFTLPANVENGFIATSTVVSGVLTPVSNVRLDGNALANDLSFNTTGSSNTLAGAAGDDFYRLYSNSTGAFPTGWSVVENASEGNDTLWVSRSNGTIGNVLSLTIPSNVETLDLWNAYYVNGVGSTGNDTLVGAGNVQWAYQTLTGLTGDDTYRIYAYRTTAVEAAGEGTDTVELRNNFDWWLDANVENLNASFISYSARLTGNALANTITGGSGNNILDGGTGADTLAGGTGDDTYVVDNAADSVSEAANAGTDSVQTTLATYTLGSNVENLRFTATTNNTGTGNTLNNLLEGAAGADSLSGLDGNDTLFGGGNGADTLLGGNGDDLLKSAAYTIGRMGLRTEYYNNTYSFSTINYISYENPNQNWGTAWPNILTGSDNYCTRWLGQLNLSPAEAGTYNFKIAADQYARLWVDGVLVADSYTALNTSGDVTLTAGAHDIRIEYTEISGNASLSWQWKQSAATTWADVPTDHLSWGPAPIAADTAGDSLDGGAGNDTLLGGQANDTLQGGDGNDWLEGASGVDSLVGGLGNDVLRSAREAQVYQGLKAEYFNSSNLLVEQNPNWVRQETPNFNWGTAAPDALIGADNFTVRWTGDINIGASEAGLITFGAIIDDRVRLFIDDQLVLSRDSALATVADGTPVNLSEGKHRIRIEYVEGGSNAAMQLQWKLAGQTTYSDITADHFSYTAQTAAGDTQGDMLQAGAGDDYLQGGGGTDTLQGGAGNDTYVVNDTADTLTENAAEGTDTVQASVSWDISASPNLENIALTGSSAINATGNSGANVLTGNLGANLLNGGGGNDTLNGWGGADTLEGGLGDDKLLADGGSTLRGGDGNDTLTLGKDWAPTALGNQLAMWLDAADLNGNGLREGAAETGVVDGRVVMWADKSGKGNHAYNLLPNGVGNSAPTFEAKGLNGLPTLRFDGLDDMLRVPTLNIGSDTIAVNAMWMQNTTDTQYMPFTYGTTGFSFLADQGGSGINNVNYWSAAQTYYRDGNTLNTASRATIYTDLNGAAHGVATLGLLRNVADMRIGGGSTWGTGWYYSGQFGDYILTTGTLSDADRQLLEGFMAWKWGTQNLLSATHPYKNAAPILAASIGGTLDGGAGNDTLTGGNGDDTLIGGAGNDSLVGGLGNDVYDLDNASDVVVEAANAGTDTVQANFNYTLGTNLENLTLTGNSALNGTGNALNNVLTGNSANNQLDGGAGNDTLDGGAGADTLIGGTGDDVLVVDDANDVVTENAGEGTDTVRASLSYTLGANLENLTLTGTADLNGTGNALANVITGNSGNNTLDGGAGADTLIGAAGNDSYLVDNVGDVVTENAGEGSDTVQASVNYTLSANVENLTLTGTGNLNGTGNEVANVITGNAGNNTLDGGTGADTLIGGAGNDSYSVDNVGDVVTESAAQGTDTVQASVSYTLSANVENLTLSGMADLNGTGNSLNNVITGNAGNNTLDGGAGADTLAGGTGNDSYVLDSTGDVVTENAGEGTDTVQANFSYTLGANLENLTLTGTANLNGTGNALSNLITGNSGNNTLDGGAGADTLIGAAGNDSYFVDNVGDVVTENAGEGSDTVQASVSYTLSANVENLTLTGSADLHGTGNGQDNLITGNSGNNTLNGDAGADTLTGGAGNDTLDGGAGNDVYVFGRGDGQDWVSSSTDTTANKVDTLHLGTGISTGDVYLQLDGENLLLSINGSTDQIAFEGFMVNGSVGHSGNPLQQIVFTDGTTWGLTDIVNRLPEPGAGASGLPEAPSRVTAAAGADGDAAATHAPAAQAPAAQYQPAHDLIDLQSFSATPNSSTGSTGSTGWSWHDALHNADAAEASVVWQPGVGLTYQSATATSAAAPAQPSEPLDTWQEPTVAVHATLQDLLHQAQLLH